MLDLTKQLRETFLECLYMVEIISYVLIWRNSANTRGHKSPKLPLDLMLAITTMAYFY